MKSKKPLYWKICIVLAIFFSLLTFTPLVMSPGVIKPMLFGIPYTLWISFIITVILVALTFIGTRVHPVTDEEDEVQS